MSGWREAWQGVPRGGRIALIIFGVLVVMAVVGSLMPDPETEKVATRASTTIPATPATLAPTTQGTPAPTQATTTTEATTTTTRPRPTTTTTLPGIPGTGTFRVGADVDPGTYRTPGPAAGRSSCYWERESSFSGGFDSIIANDNIQGPGVVTIAETDKGFKTSGCQRWEKVD